MRVVENLIDEAVCIAYIRKKLPQTAILMQLAEECAEAAQAALKLARVMEGVNPTPVSEGEATLSLMEEMADVCVCLGCLNNVDYDYIDATEKRKLNRWATRLAKRGQK